MNISEYFGIIQIFKGKPTRARDYREDPHRNYREACVLQYVFCCFGICVLEYVFCCFSIIFLEALEGAFFQTLPPEIWLGDRGVEEPTVASIPG